MNSTNKIELLIQAFDLSGFLTQNKHLNGESFLLRNKNSTNFINGLLANQLNLYPKAKNKLPTFYQNHCWFSPKGFEQCSSEAAAILKSKLFKGDNLLDLSGGLGVDDWAFSFSFNSITSLDPDANLNVLVRENYRKLGITNITRLDLKAEDFLVQNEHKRYDLIYLDADRRNPEGRDYSLAGGNPNYLELEPSLFKVGKRILLKLSPMADLSYLIKSIPHLKKIMVVGLKSEVKEILVEIVPGFQGNLETYAMVLDHTETIKTWPNEIQIPIPQETNLLYFVEAHNVLVKSNLAKAYLLANHISIWGNSGIFGLARFEPKEFMGRTLKVVCTMPYQKSEFKRYLKSLGIKQANFTKRDFPTQVEVLRKTFGIMEGGNDYFFFTTIEDGSLQVCHCTREN